MTPAVQAPSPIQTVQPASDTTVENMETSPSNFIRVGVLRTDSCGDEAAKVHRAALAHVYPTRSNTKKRDEVQVALDQVVGTEIFEMFSSSSSLVSSSICCFCSCWYDFSDFCFCFL